MHSPKCLSFPESPSDLAFNSHWPLNEMNARVDTFHWCSGLTVLSMEGPRHNLAQKVTLLEYLPS
jgi:hypothetical protein